MPSRPAIPAEIARDVLFESGHRCAVCGAGCPLERAHIIPWHQSKEHKAEDLICLCANCHERADLEDWGEKTLRQYKQKPMVMRQYGQLQTGPATTSRLKLTIDLAPAEFSEKEQRWLQYALAAFLDVEPAAIQVVSIESGSVVAVVELPKGCAQQLAEAYEKSDPELGRYLAPLTLIALGPERVERDQDYVAAHKSAPQRSRRKSHPEERMSASEMGALRWLSLLCSSLGLGLILASVILPVEIAPVASTLGVALLPTGIMVFVFLKVMSPAIEIEGRTARLAKHWWLWIAGLAGLVGTLSLIVEGSNLLHGFMSQKSANAAQATMIAVMDAQLGVQSTLVSYGASDVQSGPTATAISREIAQLMSTREALGILRAKVEPTLTAGATGAEDTPVPDTALKQVASQVPGVSAELVDFSRFENVVTAKLRFTNSGDEDQPVWPTANGYLLDEATQKKYQVTEQSNPTTGNVPAGGSIDAWAKYALPQEDQPKHLTLILNHGILFEHLKVQ